MNDTELQTRNKPKSNPLIWLGVMAVSAALVLYLFLSLYQRGEKIGEFTPKTERTTKAEGGATAVNLEKLKVSTPDLVSKGDALFQINCASCHGPKGAGDGPRAAELNPRPRNYHTEKFKYGALSSQIFNTLTNGSPGTSMPSFALLPPEDRWALVHFVRSQIPNPPKEEETAPVQALEEKKTTTTAQTAKTAPPPAQAKAIEGPRIPIQLAMQQLAIPSAQPKPPSEVMLEQKGAILFGRYCIPCHGPHGESRQTVYLLRINPDRFVRSGNLQNPNAAWVKDKKRFVEIVTKGFPGHLMPGLKSLSQTDLNALYAHVLRLANSPNP